MGRAESTALAVPSGTPNARERSQPESAADADFKPLQLLMQTPVSVEYGDKLAEKLTIHEEILRCYSPLIEQRCLEATPLREQYAKSKSLLDQVAKFVFPEVTAEQFDKHKLADKAIPIILDIYSAYPLEGHVRGVQETIDEAIQVEFGRKNTKVREKKGPRDPTEDTSAPARLPMLNSQGVQHVAEKIFTKLHRISKHERFIARKDAIKATAQHRIILPSVDKTTIQSFIDWIYRGKLQCRDTEQLFALLNLSIQMGTVALTELCVAKLHAAVSACIQEALANGLGVEALLNPPSSPPNVVQVVFNHVIKSEHPPKRLLQLVLDTIAASLNADLWAQFRDSMSHLMSLQLIDAIVALQTVNIESYQTGVKSEDDK